MSNRDASELASKALKLGWDGELPVNPKKIAESLVFIKKDSKGRKREYEIVVRGKSGNDLGGASGQAILEQREGDDYFACEYNKDEVSHRSRFTVAHELGHVLLGHVNEENSKLRDTTFNSTTSDPDERAANAFAAELIMPSARVKELYRAARNIQQLAEAFGVSTQAMTFRLKNLGIIS